MIRAQQSDETLYDMSVGGAHDYIYLDLIRELRRAARAVSLRHPRLVVEVFAPDDAQLVGHIQERYWET